MNNILSFKDFEIAKNNFNRCQIEFYPNKYYSFMLLKKDKIFLDFIYYIGSNDYVINGGLTKDEMEVKKPIKHYYLVDFSFDEIIKRFKYCYENNTKIYV